MAQPIPFVPPHADPRAALQTKLQQAPEHHAQAILAAYEALQGLYDSGALDLLCGLLGSRDKVLGVAVDAAASPASVRALRNIILLVNMLGAINPATLATFTRTAPEALRGVARQPERPRLWNLAKDFVWNTDFRRGMAAVNAILEALGRNLSDGHGPSDAPTAELSHPDDPKAPA